MQRALDLARLGKGRTSPNPVVGCVIVYNDEIIGEGWHHKAGEPHAEVNAIDSVADHELLKRSTLYVTLEPCSFHGRTPPCSHLIVDKCVNKVVVACTDPNPKVAGSGIRYLKEHGIEVITGVLEGKALELNSQFIFYQSYQQPFITLKWAQSKDGFIDPRTGANKQGQVPVSGKTAKILTHKLRSEHDAILVGSTTLKTDKPQLNVRDWKGKNPLKILIDRNLEFYQELNIIGETWILNERLSKDEENIRFLKFNFIHLIDDLLEELHEKNKLSLFVEGGSNSLQRFIDSGKWNQAIIYTSDILFKKGLVAPKLKGELIEKRKDL